MFSSGAVANRFEPRSMASTNNNLKGVFMKRILVSAALAAVLVFSTAIVASSATSDDAKAMVQKAVAFYKANGKEKAIAEFNNPKGQFVKGDLYVVVQGYDGVLLANGGNQKIVGQNHLELKDPGGKFFVKEMVETAKKGGGWVTYEWVNPVTKKIGTKKAWIQGVEGDNLYINVGFFE
jgi:cytochrome c